MTQRDWQKDMDRCLSVNDWHEHPWEAGSEEGSNVWRIYEIIPDEPCEFVAECETELVTDFIMTAHQALPYWLQEAKERGRRERILKKSLEHCIKEYPLYDSKEIGGSLMMDFMKNTLSILYPDTSAPKEGDL
ncbi:hypothetical protein NST28_29185 [Paenibacillus sp. FSL R10-2791]|uniref:hypothetical protein n=1 Tax=Paenibacillus sp. FSL R10-2791 TaxID=2954695 RepID=UPI0030FBAB73